MVLEAELNYYEEQKQGLLLHHRGQIALIKNHELVGVFSNEEDAFTAGVARFGTGPFLVQVIQDDEEFIQLPALTVGLISADP